MNGPLSMSRQTTLVERGERAAPTMTGGMRALLRDTALLKANFAADNTKQGYAEIRQECVQALNDFGEALVSRGVPHDIQEDAKLAQCALLDEIALQRLDETGKSEWASQPLQVTYFKQHDAGERVFERLAVRMRERTPQVDLLECFAAILGLGFKGRFALTGESGGETQRQAVMAELAALLTRLRPVNAPSLLIDAPGPRFAGWFRRLSPWAMAGIGCAVAFTVWLLWHVALDLQLAALATLPNKP